MPLELRWLICYYHPRIYQLNLGHVRPIRIDFGGGIKTDMILFTDLSDILGIHRAFVSGDFALIVAKYFPGLT